MTDLDVPTEEGAEKRGLPRADDPWLHGTDLVFLVVVLLSAWVILGELFGRAGGEGRGNWHIVVGRYIQPIGWGATILAVGATIYYSTKRSVLFGLTMAATGAKASVGRGLRRALDQHIVVSVVAVGLAGLHVLNFIGAIRLTTGWLAIGLMLVVTASGIFGRFVATAPALRRHWRRFHLPFTALFFIVLAVHILVKVGLTGDGGD